MAGLLLLWIWRLNPASSPEKTNAEVLNRPDASVANVASLSISNRAPQTSTAAVTRAAVDLPPDRTNLIANGLFALSSKGRPDNWNYNYDENAVVLDPKGGKDGKACLSIRDAKAEADARQSGIILVAGETYKISGYLRTKGFSNGKGGIGEGGFALINVGWSKTEGITPDAIDSGWKYYEKTFRAPESKNGSYEVVLFMAGSRGELAVSDVRLEAISDNAKKDSRNTYDDPNYYRIIPVQPKLGAIPADKPFLTLVFPYVGASEENAYECRVTLRSSANPATQPLTRNYAIQGGEIRVDLHGLSIGAAEVETSIVEKSSGTTVCATRMAVRVVPPANLNLAGIRPLNSLVSELARTKVAATPSGTQQCRFVNPRDGWVFVALTPGAGSAGVAACLAAAPKDKLVEQQAGKIETLEAMRWLQAGEHSLAISASQASNVDVVVRSVPELLYDGPGYQPDLKPMGRLDWKFLEKHVLPACNTFVRGNLSPEEFSRMSARGMRWFATTEKPPKAEGVLTSGALAALSSKMAEHWIQQPGFTDPKYCGMTIDEFNGHESPRDYFLYARAFEQTRRATPKDRHFYAFFTGPLGAKRSCCDFLATLFNVTDSKIMYETYCATTSTQAASEKQLNDILVNMRRYREYIPNAQEHLICVLIYYTSILTTTWDPYPGVDIKYLLDMEMNMMATQPEFQGLYGLGMYTSRHADEETLRWAWRLMRHYGIEGQRGMLSETYGFSYRPGHLQNSDFERGLEGWNVSAAEEGAVRADQFKGYGRIQGRTGSDPALGDTFLVMRRSAKGENRVSQTVRNLVPGKLYSMQYVVANLKGLKSGKSAAAQYALRATLENVDIIPHKSFVYVNQENYEAIEPFSKQKPFCANLRRIVFRAKAPTATLTFGDWQSAQEPGGPSGQELIVNYVHMKPYFED